MVELWEVCRSPNTAKNSILSSTIFAISSFCAGHHIAGCKKNLGMGVFKNERSTGPTIADSSRPLSKPVGCPALLTILQL